MGKKERYAPGSQWVGPPLDLTAIDRAEAESGATLTEEQRRKLIRSLERYRHYSEGFDDAASLSADAMTEIQRIENGLRLASTALSRLDPAARRALETGQMIVSEGSLAMRPGELLASIDDLYRHVEGRNRAWSSRKVNNERGEPALQDLYRNLVDVFEEAGGRLTANNQPDGDIDSPLIRFCVEAAAALPSDQRPDSSTLKSRIRGYVRSKQTPPASDGQTDCD